MEKPDTNRFEAVSATVHEPVAHLKIWIDGTIKIHACDPEGGPAPIIPSCSRWSTAAPA